MIDYLLIMFGMNGKNLLEDEGLYSFYKANIKNENIRNGVKEVSEFLIDYWIFYKAGEQ